MGEQHESQKIARARKMIVRSHGMKKNMQLSLCSFVLLFRFALSRPLSLAVDIPGDDLRGKHA
jgi:hypothetical protein